MVNKNFFSAILVLFAVSVVLNVYLLSGAQTHKAFVEKVKQYPFLSQKILSENTNDLLLNFLSLRQDLQGTTKDYGENFSLYFEYLPTGTSIGVNSTNEFHLASLFKLPVVIAYYHQQERLKNPDDPIITIQQSDLDNQFGDLYKKGAGYKIKLSDAVKLALVDSDNTAIKLVVPRITQDDFEHVYQALDLNLTTDKNGAILTTKGYSSVLKALYFASVINKDDSEHILDLMTKTKYVDKLPAGVPDNIPVSHKIGVYNTDGKDQAFTDCGIVYVPSRPYILCMYSQTDEQTARERMQKISKMVYDYVSGE